MALTFVRQLTLDNTTMPLLSGFNFVVGEQVEDFFSISHHSKSNF